MNIFTVNPTHLTTRRFWMRYMDQRAASGQSSRRFSASAHTSKFTHQQPQTLPIVARLEPQPNKQGLADTTVIPIEIVGRYVGLAWELGVVQAGVS